MEISIVINMEKNMKKPFLYFIYIFSNYLRNITKQAFVQWDCYIPDRTIIG